MNIACTWVNEPDETDNKQLKKQEDFNLNVTIYNVISEDIKIFPHFVIRNSGLFMKTFLY